MDYRAECTKIIPHGGLAANADFALPASVHSSDEAAGRNSGKIHDFVSPALRQLEADMNSVFEVCVNDMRRNWEKSMERLKGIETSLRNPTGEPACEAVWKPFESPTINQFRKGQSCMDAAPEFTLPVSTFHVAHLEESVSVGKAAAEEAALGSGFMGGAGLVMQLIWMFFGLSCLYFSFKVESYELAAAHDDAARLATRTLYVAAYLPTGVCFLARGYLLRVHRFRSAYLVMTAGIAWTTVTYCLLRLHSLHMIIHFGCSWQDEEFLLLHHRESCVPLAAFRDCLGLLLCFITCRGVVLLYQFRREDAADAFMCFSAGAVPFNALSFVYNAIFGFPDMSKALIDLAVILTLGGMATFVWYTRRVSRRLAWHLVREDSITYDERWNHIVSNNKVVVDNIAAAVRDVERRIHKHVVGEGVASPKRIISMRSFVDDHKDVLLAPKSRDGDDTAATLRQFLPSLPLLYAQAYALNDHFQAKCAEWAAGVGEHRRASVKRQCRALEKLWRTYKGNARFLMDLVRSTIVCDSLDDLLTVFDRINVDPDAGIVRVKNRFDPKYQSVLSGGYRNLSLNVIICDEHTSRACTAAHICEVQLSLRCFDDLRTEGGHRRFVSFRNARAE